MNRIPASNGPSLAGQTILVLRPAEDSTLAPILLRLGARVIEAPSIRFVPPADMPRLDAALHDMAQYDWVVLTSPHGVQTVLERLAELGVPWPKRPRVAAVGAATCRRLEQRGVPVAFVPTEFRTTALAQELPTRRTDRVLLLRARDGNPALASTLRERVETVEDVEAYATCPDPGLGVALNGILGNIDWIVFSSPSMVASFQSQLPAAFRLLASARIACIGPVTAAAARASGLTVHAEAQPHTAEGLAHCILTEASQHA